MRVKHVKKAFTGVVVWYAVFVASVVALVCAKLSPDWPRNLGGTLATLLVVGLILQFIIFFWCCHHLTIAKGYPTSLSILGVFGPPVQLFVLTILLVMPDKAPLHTLLHRTEKDRRGR